MKLKILGFFVLLLMVTSSCNDVRPCDKVFHRILGEWIKEAKNLDLIGVGPGGGIKEEKITNLGITFRTEEMMNLSEAREKIVAVCSLVSNIVERHPEYLGYFPDYRLDINTIETGIIGPAPPDADTDHISAVILVVGNVAYFSAESQKERHMSTRVHEETYEEALEIVQQGSTSVTQAEPA